MKINYSLDDMRLFWVVAKQGSFSKAALELSMPISTLSRRIKNLEQSLQLRLLNRDAHRVTLTGSGVQYFQRCGGLLEALQSAGDALFDEKGEASGTINVSAPNNFTQYKLAHIFNAFLREYPKISINLSLSNKNIDLEKEHIDLAFRACDEVPLDWISRPLKQVKSIVCSSPALIEANTISHPKELQKLPVILSNPVRVWELVETTTGEKFSYTPLPPARLEADDLHVVSRAVIEGLGVGFIPYFMASEWIESGKLVRLLPKWSGQPRTVHLLYRDRDNMPHRLRLLIDYLIRASDN
ncbi:LysR family transcriptional regulator [Pseudoalteromonas sp. J010]|uniref:LysR family transcriptional regulator n=1 Tax=Pseudoalteromonas sp. J010 TaxID=998465 RepID=UPI000F6492BA|nr:LysR family transcriptional regulator [Pseudoalteromonas sp. J010]RRS09323.1 LysR family transcriptional regulator [Pseudoalteromonas sp. J010]